MAALILPHRQGTASTLSQKLLDPELQHGVERRELWRRAMRWICRGRDYGGEGMDRNGVTVMLLFLRRECCRWYGLRM